MFACVQGKIIPEAGAVVSVLDRSFLYGDGAFETIYAQSGRAFRLEAHLDRLALGAALLGVRLPLSRATIAQAVAGLLARNAVSPALLRLTLSRGVGARGYSPRAAEHPVLVITQHPSAPPPDAPPRWRLRIASWRLPAGDRLAAIKSCNKLLQILARAEAEAAGDDEAILLNTNGHAVEAAAGNLFFIRDAAVCTAPLVAGVLPGVTRSVVMELCADAGIPTREVSVQPSELAEAEAVFVTLSTLGVVSGASLDGRPLRESPLVSRLHRAYWAGVARECGAAPVMGA